MANEEMMKNYGHDVAEIMKVRDEEKGHCRQKDTKTHRDSSMQVHRTIILTLSELLAVLGVSPNLVHSRPLKLS